MLIPREILLCTALLAAQLVAATPTDTSVLQIGCDEDDPPYSTRDERGKPLGFAVDILREALHSAGYPTDFRIDHTGFLITGARSNRYDVIVSSLLDDRGLLATRPFHTDQPVVYVRVGTQLESLIEGGSITQRGAVVRGAIARDRLQSIGLRGIPIPLTSARIALNLLVDGTASYVVMDRLAAVTAIRDYRIAGVAPLLRIENSPRDCCFHLAPTHSNLLVRLDAALTAMDQNGRLDQIYRQWFAVAEPQPVKLEDLRPYVPALLLLIILVAGLHLWRLEKKTLALQDAVQARERAQLDLRDSEERFRQIAENVHEVFWISDVQKTRIEYVSPGYERVWGRDTRELLAHPMSWVEGIHPDDRNRVSQAALREQTSGRYDQTYRVLRPDGSIRWVRDRAFPVRNANGEVFRIVGIAEDVTTAHEARERITQLGRSQEEAVARRTQELQAANDALREAQERVKALLHAIPDMVFRMSADGTFLDYSAPHARVHVPADRIIGSNIRAMGFPDVMLQQVLPAMDRALATAEIVTCEYALPEADGLHHFEARMVKSGAREIVAAVREITERRRFEDDRRTLEARLFQSQKMEAIGTLAGGIAHDFNNILSAILGYSELLAMDDSTPPQVREMIQQITTAGQRGADMVRQILTFSRRQLHERRPLRLQPVVRESLRFLRASLPATVEFGDEIDPAAPAAYADPTQIQQVVMNLCTNAAHAMRDRPGRLTVALREEVVAETTGHSAEVQPGRYACLTVADTGIGIPEAALPHIFEPFFTTKGIGEGTGLGLAVVHGIVKEHEGSITVTTREQVGTTFRVYLPAMEIPAASSQEITDAIQRGRGEHILLIDDEPPMSDMGRRLLTHLGYRVTAFTQPQEALERFMADPQSFDLVMTDMNMPRLSGIDLARAVHATEARTPILLVSGHLAAEHIPPVEETGIRAMLAKPFTARQLSSTLRRMLDAETA